MICRGSIASSVDAISTQVVQIAKRIHQHPELRFQEHRAVDWLTERLELAGLSVERGLAGLPTAFRARIGSARGPRVAILAEYDALPELGHACGHNLIAGGALGAFLGLARLNETIPGHVEIIGTPGEEGGGGKIQLLNAGVFDGVDAAMMFHPYDRDILTHPALASRGLDVTFGGALSHAIAAPWDGTSALTACLETLRLVDSQRGHFRDGVRVHSYVTDGGQATNVVPDHAGCHFSLRAPASPELERVANVVQRCVRGAAMACGATFAIKQGQSYREMRSNMTLARQFGVHLSALGRTARTTDPRVGSGSTDMGNISQVLPSIHPYLAICDEGESLCHQSAFTACAASDRGFATMLTAAKAMAQTAVELLEDPALLAAVKAEFDEGSETGHIDGSERYAPARLGPL
jgi:amidohydrolase